MVFSETRTPKPPVKGPQTNTPCSRYRIAAGVSGRSSHTLASDDLRRRRPTARRLLLGLAEQSSEWPIWRRRCSSQAGVSAGPGGDACFLSRSDTLAAEPESVHLSSLPHAYARADGLATERDSVLERSSTFLSSSGSLSRIGRPRSASRHAARAPQASWRRRGSRVRHRAPHPRPHPRRHRPRCPQMEPPMSQHLSAHLAVRAP
jgi:hypothetical protein